MLSVLVTGQTLLASAAKSSVDEEVGLTSGLAGYRRESPGALAIACYRDRNPRTRILAYEVTCEETSSLRRGMRNDECVFVHQHAKILLFGGRRFSLFFGAQFVSRLWPGFCMQRCEHASFRTLIMSRALGRSLSLIYI